MKKIKKKINLQLFATPGMANPDIAAQNELEIQNKLKEAIETNDSEAFVKAQVELAKNIEAKILQEAKAARDEDINDNAVMVKRGLNPLTSEEKEYYNEIGRAHV